MRATSPFDPRNTLSVEIRDGGTFTISQKDMSGAWVTTEHRHREMSVFIDGVERIEGGLVISGDDTLVAMNPCGSCGEWMCNLVEGWAAKVVRIGPYVFWVVPSGELYCFDVERYVEVFGGNVEKLPTPESADLWDLDPPAPSNEYEAESGEILVFDARDDPDAPLARLWRWPERPVDGLEVVRPPDQGVEVIEIRSMTAGSPSFWLDRTPRSDGRRAGYFPGVTCFPVWLAGLEIDRVIAALS